MILSTRTLESNPCFGLNFKDGVYLFNVPDQTQRLFRENGYRFSKLLHIFLTSLGGKSIGGFQGLLITVYESKNRIANFCALPEFQNVLDSYHNLHTIDSLQPKLFNTYSDQNIEVVQTNLKHSCTYEVKLCDIPGKFLVDKAKALGLKSGPIFRDLTDGKCVTAPDGKIITPEMVIAPSVPGDKLFVVDCNSMEDVEMLQDCRHFDFVAHVTDLNYLMTPEYLAHFDANTKGICFGPTGKIIFPSISLLYSKIIGISPNLFTPLVVFGTDELNIPLEVKNAYPRLEYQFAPVEKKRFVIPNETEKFEEYQEQPMSEFETFAVTFNGTGSMYPSKYRNVAGILLHSKSGFIVLDCGEGCAGQLRRRFGAKNFVYIMQHLICIFITHLHGDHHFGLYQLLQERAKVCDTNVDLICHQLIENHIRVLQSSSRFGSLKYNHHDYSKIFVSGNVSVQPIPVNHCIDAHGVVCVLDGGYRVAYSGDRHMGDKFPETIQSCDLLIHEATFSDDLALTAGDKRHSTIGQAIQTGKLANAQYVILTHFSQRYPKLPVFGVEDKNVAFAFDYLSFKFEDIEELCKVCPQIFQMIVDLEEKDKDTE